MTPLTPLVVGTGAPLSAIVAQTVAPTSAIVDQGAVAVLGVAFLTIMYAVAKGRIVSRDTAEHERRLVELTEELKALTVESHERGRQLQIIAERNMSWLEGKAGRSDRTDRRSTD